MSATEEHRKRNEFVQLFIQRNYFDKINLNNDLTEQAIWTDEDGYGWYMRKFVYRTIPTSFATKTIYLMHDNEAYLRTLIGNEEMDECNYNKCFFSKVCMIYFYENPKYRNILEPTDIVYNDFIFRQVCIRDAEEVPLISAYVFK